MFCIMTNLAAFSPQKRSYGFTKPLKPFKIDTGLLFTKRPSALSVRFFAASLSKYLKRRPVCRQISVYERILIKKGDLVEFVGFPPLNFCTNSDSIFHGCMFHNFYWMEVKHPPSFTV